MNTRMIEFYMGLAGEIAKMSRAVRLQVGALIVKDGNILAFGWNGTPMGWSNNCEEREYPSPALAQWTDREEIEEEYPYFDNDKNLPYRLVTLGAVLHAEENCIGKLAKGTSSGMGSSMFLTHAPCIHCAKIIHAAGITELFYHEIYRSNDGLDFLSKCCIKTTKIT